MESGGADKIPMGDEAEGSETTIEIKIKTLDAQTYTLRVDKQVIALAFTKLYHMSVWWVFFVNLSLVTLLYTVDDFKIFLIAAS